ncbi:MAG TPA: ABC transporter ATP-binding protein, partial [Blastocatellia bacterium]|nr:ABC transporter ATP-binding protein [Blastocatellia bacterium]
SSHILSDVEALCDRAAILSRGKLVRYGTVDELAGAQDSAVEVIALGVDASDVRQLSESISSVEAARATPNGVHLVLADETDVDEALAAIRRCGGKLLSINPRRRSLEDVFSSSEHQG